MKPKILDKTKKKKIVEEVSVFGISKIPYLLIKVGEKIRAYSGCFSKEDILVICRTVPVMGIGLYFGREFVHGKSGKRNVRLNLDSLHVLKNQVSKNIIELNEEQEEDWFYGRDVEVSEQQTRVVVEGSFVVLKSGDKFKDIIGVGRLSADKNMVSCYLPKERRVRV